MRCSHCGTENKDYAKFCMHCGQKLEEPAKDNKPPVGGRGRILVALCLVAVVAAVVAIMFRPHSELPVEDGEAKDVPAVLEEMRQANGGELPEMTFADQGVLTFVSGRLSNRIVNDSVVAQQVLNDIAPVLGIANADADLTLLDESDYEGTSFYRFQRLYNGLPVHGVQTVLAVDGKGSVTALCGAVDLGDVGNVRSPNDTGGFNPPEGAELVYLQNDTGGLGLSWRHVSGGSTTFYSVDDGSVIGEESLLRTADKFDGAFSPTVTEGGIFELRDSAKNLEVYDAGGETLRYRRLVSGTTVFAAIQPTDEEWWLFGARKECDPKNIEGPNDQGLYTIKDGKGKVLGSSLTLQDALSIEEVWIEDEHDGRPILSSSSKEWNDTPNEAIEAAAVIGELYDYYDQWLHWKGYDNKNGRLRIVVRDRMNDSENCYSYGGLISFSTFFGVDRDIAGHEYAHSVVYGVMQEGMLSDSGEAGTLSEAYADILSCVALNNTSWVIEGNKGFRRSAADPETDKHPARVAGKYWKDPKNRSTDVHDSLTVISHSAYLMYENGLTMDEIGKIWFVSLRYLSPKSSFSTCRAAVIEAAETLGFDEDKLQIIRDAFDSVGVGGPACVLSPDAEIRAFNSDGSPHEGIKIGLKNHSPANVAEGVDDISVSLTTDGSSAKLSELLEKIKSGVVPPSTGLRRLDLTVSDDADESVSVSTVIMIAESGLSRLDVDLGTPGNSELPVDDSQYTIHFSTADLVLPEALRGEVKPVVDADSGAAETVHHGGLQLLIWDPDTSWLDQARESGEPTDNADVDTQTLSDGTELIFGVANDGYCYVEIISPQGHRGILWSRAYNDFVADMLDNPPAVDSCRQLQAAAAGMSPDEDAYDIVMAFLRVCAEQVTFTGDAPADEQASSEVVLGKTPEGTYLLAGTVRVHEENFIYGDNPGYVNVVSLVLDEQVPYQYEYKGTVDAIAQEVALETERDDSYGTWAQYDGQHIAIECDELRGVYHDNANLNVDTMAMGTISLVSVG